MSDPKGFMKFSRLDPQREPVQKRLQHWNEFYKPFQQEDLRTQAARCMDCGVPFCQSDSGCPVANLIPEWNALIHSNRWHEALHSLHSTNNFPEFTGKLCPAPCESACVLGIQNSPVAIRTVESNIIEHGFQKEWVRPIHPSIKTGKRVAIVGSGPAGLAAAQQLRRGGHEVTVFEKANLLGGLLRYGIPDFKMEKWVLDRRLKQLFEEGVQFRTGIEIGVQLSIEQLTVEYDAICLTVGAETPRDLDVPGRQLPGIHFAMDFLIQQNQINAGANIPERERITAQNKKVVILGGGDTGSDCLGTSHRQGAAEIHQFEILSQPPKNRSSSTPWPDWPLQLRTSHAHEEGGKRAWGVATHRFTENPTMQNVQVGKLHGSKVAFEGGKPVVIPGTEFELEADLVLLAMGFSGPKRSRLIEELGVGIDARGNIQVDADYMTSVSGIFAAGDAKRGASLIVWAIAEGRKMASAVTRYLQIDQIQNSRKVANPKDQPL